MKHYKMHGKKALSLLLVLALLVSVFMPCAQAFAMEGGEETGTEMVIPAESEAEEAEEEPALPAPAGEEAPEEETAKGEDPDQPLTENESGEGAETAGPESGASQDPVISGSTDENSPESGTEETEVPLEDLLPEEELSEAEAEALLAAARPESLGKVTVGRNSLIRLPIQSKHVVNTRWWYAIHNGTKYMGVCARASSTGPVDPSYPDSRTESCNYNYLTEEVVNKLAAWQKSGESASSYPMPIVTGRGYNARLAKAVLVSNFIRDEIWLDHFSSFAESYAAAHLLVSYLLFGDDDRAYGSNYDLVFNQMASQVSAWLENPENAAIVDACTAYIAFLQKDCQSIVWVEGVPGVLTLQKKAVDEDGEEVSDIDLAGTTYAVYTDEACSSPAMDVTGKEALLVCDSQGKAGKVLLSPGTYYLKETKAAPGLELSEEVYKAKLSGTTKYGEKLNLTSKTVSDRTRETEPFGSLVIEKTDGHTAGTRGGASLQGAVYELRVDQDEIKSAEKTYARGEVFARLTTDKKGKASLEEIPAGSYILKETKAPRGYKLSEEETQVLIRGEETLSLTGDAALKEELITAPFRFEKVSSAGSGMAGIPFLVTCQESGASWTVYTDESGAYDSEKEEDQDRQRLPYGTYTLKETACDANEGYRLADPVTFKIEKETALTLDRIVNYRDLSVRTLLSDEKGHKCLRAEENIVLQDKVSLSDFYEYVGKEIRIKSVLTDRETGEEILSGERTRTLSRAQETMTIRFTLDASALAGRSLVCFEYIYDEEGNEIAKHADPDDAEQTVSFPRIGTKAVSAASRDQVLAESGRIVILDTIRYQGLEGGATYKAEGLLFDSKSGQAFQAGGKDVSAQVTFTADPSGQGEVQAEFSFDAPEGFGGTTLTAAEILYDLEGRLLCEHRDLEDPAQTVYAPRIRTNASDSLTGDHVGQVSSKAVLRDIVTYSNLVPGAEYTVSGRLMNQETGEALLSNGKEITASRTFTAERRDGAIELLFTFDASLLEGHTLVCFEELTHKGLTVAAHADLTDQEQAVTYPQVRTTACDMTSKDHLGIPGLGRLLGMPEETKITDRVKMKGLVPGMEYTLQGSVWDQAEGKELTNEKGEAIRASKTFTASQKEESLELVFVLPSSLLAGKTAVVCEDLIHKGVITAFHHDMKDEEQSVHYPEISTSLTDDLTGTHGGVIQKETTIRDRAFYSNLIPSTRERPTVYTMQGTLMCKSTCTPLLDRDGKEITSSVTFTPEQASGSVELTFTFDSSLLQGETLVCFERLDREDLLVAVHADLEDEDQSIHYPAVCTRAQDDLTETRTGAAGKEASVTDYVEYSNLMPGSYIAKGLLVDQKTGLPIKDLEGREVTAQAAFTNTALSGEVPLTFHFSAEGFYGRTLVAFQSIYTEEGDLIVAHEDPEDQEEMIFYPSIATKASVEGGKSAAPSGSVKVTDHVEYKNLLPGTQYQVTGVLMDKATGKPLLVKGKEVTAKTAFTAESADGSVSLTFTFDADGLGSRTLVAFERLLVEETEVAVHADLEDEDQTIHLTPPPEKPKTGDETRPALFASAALIGLLGAGALGILSRKKKH